MLRISGICRPIAVKFFAICPRWSSIANGIYAMQHARLSSVMYNNRSHMALHGLTRSLGLWTPAFVYAVVLLSSFSLHIFDISGNYFFEGAVFVSGIFGLLVRDSVFKVSFIALRTVRTPGVFAVLVTVFTVFLIGSMLNGNVAYAYGDFRANIFGIFGFGVAVQFRRRDPVPLILLGIATGVVSIAAWYLQINDGNASTKFSFPYLCLTTAAVLACESRRVFLTVLSVIVLVFLAAVSFYRQYWIAAALTIFFVLGYSIRSFKGSARRRMTGALLFGAVAITGGVAHEYSKIQAFFLDDQSRYIQGVGKTTALIDTLNGSGKSVQQGDDVRMSYFEFLGTQPWKLTLPHGLDYRSTLNNIDPYFQKRGYEVSTIDSLLIYLAYHYGLIIAIPLLLWITWSLWCARRRFGAIPMLSLMLILAVVLLFDGGQAVITFKAFWLGAFVALFARPISIRW